LNPEVLLRGSSLCEEFDCDLGDKRRNERLRKVAEAMALRPDASFPDMMDDPADQEALYRLLRNSEVCFGNVVGGHLDSTARRAASLGEVLVVHDTSAFHFPLRDGRVRANLEAKSKGKQGFYGHLSLAISADGLRAPLGVLGFRGFVHQSQVTPETYQFWTEEFGDLGVESSRWVGGMQEAESRLGDCRAIHVADREGDFNELLGWVASGGNRRGFVLRARYERNTADGRTISDHLAEAEVCATRVVALNSRSLQGVPARSQTFPERKAREATLSFRACHVVLKPVRAPAIELNVVQALETNPPDNEEPVRWTLLTNEDISGVEAILRVVDIYRSRWTIEEFFKAIKTGCGYSARQLDSAQTLLVALALTLPIAWQLLAIRHLSRTCPDLKATAVLTPLQLKLLTAKYPRLNWPDSPTVGDVTRGIAMLGGHHRSNGPPGWQILGRGLRKLLEMEAGVLLFMRTETCDQS
jgi:hypothetical protein